ncbi:hypothetical protein RHECNPAF_246002 [Rhizobium etli CNPAF512]|nr:hypothetical protein RHECNPAF_246002 [Rhizobium etli CNPAF512]
MLQTREADEWSFYQGTPCDAEAERKFAIGKFHPSITTFG